MPPRITKNFLLISNYNNDISWVPKISDNYLIYDQGAGSNYPDTIDRSKIIKSKHTGHNLSDYFSYIIDTYDHLPECIILAKGNVFPRHVHREYFESIMNNEFFTPIEDYTMHDPQWPKGFITSDGGFCEINTSSYLRSPGHPLKYFDNYNDFLSFCFVDPYIPRYIRFNPGAMFILPKAHILKLPKICYQNLLTLTTHSHFPGEAYIVERALYTLWAGNFVLSPNMLNPLNTNMTTIKPKDGYLVYLKSLIPPSIKNRVPIPIQRMLTQIALRIKKPLNLFIHK